MSSNYLETVLMLITSKEINNGEFYNFIKQFHTMKYNGLKLCIFINNSDYDEDIFNQKIKLINIFSLIDITILNIKKEDDIYIASSNKEVPSIIPELGLISGPNIMFFNSIKYCYKYKSVLLLESDCILKVDCFEKIKKYIMSLSDYVISGTRYVGNIAGNKDLYNTINIHFNGVAIYNTSSNDLKYLIDKTESYIKHNVKFNKMYYLAYDVSLTSVLYDTHSNDNEFIYHRRILSKFINNTFIINCSPSLDKDIKVEQINRIYPNHVILHKKL
jgi:hypothetical protein